MAVPRIDQADGVLGFGWTTPTGEPARLADLLALPDAEPHRWLPTHLEALDDVLIAVTGALGEVLGGGRAPRPEEREDLAAAYVALDRAVLEYARAAEAADVLGVPRDLRAGQILGTAHLVGVRARYCLGLAGVPPFEGELDTPGPGMVGGFAGLHRVDDAQPWRGARWLVVTEDGRRLPASLSMLLHDSSGVDKEATLREHREALAQVTEAVDGAPGSPGGVPRGGELEAAGAVDWLLFDWVMAHRESESGAGVEIRSGKVEDATMIVAAAAASVAVRARFDPALLPLASQ
ncbi:hypothetical protein [Nocardioides sp. GY 10127]|uniref:hypothetical protein n=1 Tax=Nocardioides sp. GY 10127 TaxID=2569762 RepID=UPI0010A8D4C6|nr:hypothetical protein [Nocardioides sp. GY 10127]TIC82618.1 hypothetical protein E8D37_07860 [Nocardioides sp. GY 10127]